MLPICLQLSKGANQRSNMDDSSKSAQTLMEPNLYKSQNFQNKKKQPVEVFSQESIPRLD